LRLYVSVPQDDASAIKQASEQQACVDLRAFLRSDVVNIYS